MRRATLFLLMSLPILGCGGKSADDNKAGVDPQGKPQPQGKQQATGPADVAKQFIEASEKLDVAAVKKLVTEKSLPFIEKNGVRKGAPKNYTLGKAVVNGETARVHVKADDAQFQLSTNVLLKREKGQWRVYGVSMGPLTMNFEEPNKPPFGAKLTASASDDPFGSFSAGSRPPASPPLTAVSIEDFNKSWKSDYHYKDRPARDVLSELAKKAGMKFDEGFRPLKQLDQPVSLDLDDASLARAIEEVCSKAGVHAEFRPGFRGPSTLAVEAGPRLQPPRYAGPFAVAADSLDVTARYGTGRLKLAVAAYNLPPAVEQMRKKMGGRLLKIDKLVATNGADVRQGEGTTWAGSGSQTVPLKNLLRNVKTLTLTGKISLPIPVDVKQLRFSGLKEGETKSAGEVTITIKDSEPQTQTILQFEYTKPGGGRIEFTALDPDGKPITASSSSFSLNDRVSRQVTVSGSPASLKAQLGGQFVVFKSLKPGQKQQLGGTTITLKKLRSTGRHKLTFEFKNAESNRIFITGLDADGKPLRSEGGFHFSGGKQGQIGTTLLGSPKEVVVSVVTEVKNVDYDVALKDIPVPDADQRPARLAPLQFTGDAPVTLETLGISKDGNFAKVKLRVKNHSNKDIRRLDMRLHYLDAAGKELKSWSAQADGSFNPLGGRKPVVGQKGTAEVEVTAFFMPEGTKRVKAVLQEVECADATSWKAKKK
jgi:hypothetical protein